jgi:arginine and glutamate-rich protein 1
MISNCRCQKEVELRLLEEETAKRVEQAIRRKVEETLNCEEMKQEIQRRIEEGRKRIQVEVAAQIEKQKEAALIEAKEKSVSFSLEQSLSLFDLCY